MLSLQNEIDKAEAARQADMKLKTAAAAATVAVAALAYQNPNLNPICKLILKGFSFRIVETSVPSSK